MTSLTIGSKYARPELAERWGYESHHAIGRGVVTPQGEKVIVLFVSRIKQEALTQYNDHLSGDLLFWEGQEKHGSDDRTHRLPRAPSTAPNPIARFVSGPRGFIEQTHQRQSRRPPVIRWKRN